MLQPTPMPRYEISQAFGEDGRPIRVPNPPPVAETGTEARAWAAGNGAVGFLVLVGPRRRPRYFLREKGGRRYRRVAEWDYRLEQTGRRG